MLNQIKMLLEEQKAEDIRFFDMRTRSPLADWFVVVTGAAGRHLDAMAESIRVTFKGARRRSIEGMGTTGWVLVDLGDVVVHLMTAARRAEIDLDGLWSAFLAAREENKPEE
jgi:ribosome-associated protein